MNNAAPDGALTVPVRFGWGIGSLSMSLMFNATSLLMLRYLVDFVGLGAALAGLLIGIAKIYDAITDPIMGRISDRTRHRTGRRRPYLLAGACGFRPIVRFDLPFRLLPGYELYRWPGSGCVAAQRNRLYGLQHPLHGHATGDDFELSRADQFDVLPDRIHCRRSAICLRHRASLVGGLRCGRRGPCRDELGSLPSSFSSAAHCVST